MTIRIGANPICWANDDMPELGGDTTLETILSEAKQIGFEGMELGKKFPRTPDGLRDALAPYGLACISGWYSAKLLKRNGDAEFEAAQNHLNLLKAQGSTVMVVCETSNTIQGDIGTPLSRRPKLTGDDWRAFGARMTRFGDLLAAQGMRIVYHHHMGSVVQSPDDIDAFMANTGPSVDLLLDTGHAVWGGDDPARLAIRYRDRIGHVHTKDIRTEVLARSRAEDWSFLKSVLNGVYTVPGDGTIDFRAMFRALPGYSGWVVLEAEQDPEKANPFTYASLGYANLKTYLRDEGLL
ncbi:myo-inosose-2 dehydratase [Acidisoma silvae]|uniref:Myo-inosose-2 dehydratase n=1 Tax=Acidisoma silvae TaxID=2802396 RepID=A0A963YTH1_9PROT|nr:myo-inosose-2 dehydratase [Acidisoma silvae]MCB8876083.1 myo-inosose-2 dehydratase [Acidisoma silvae]